MAQSESRPQIFMARKTFSLGSGFVRVGDTVVAGHPMLKGREQLFVPFEPTHDHERDKRRDADALAARKEAAKAAAAAAKVEAAEDAPEAKAEA